MPRNGGHDNRGNEKNIGGFEVPPEWQEELKQEGPPAAESAAQPGSTSEELKSEVPNLEASGIDTNKVYDSLKMPEGYDHRSRFYIQNYWSFLENEEEGADINEYFNGHFNDLISEKLYQQDAENVENPTTDPEVLRARVQAEIDEQFRPLSDDEIKAMRDSWLKKVRKPEYGLKIVEFFNTILKPEAKPSRQTEESAATPASAVSAQSQQGGERHIAEDLDAELTEVSEEAHIHPAPGTFASLNRDQQHQVVEAMMKELGVASPTDTEIKSAIKDILKMETDKAKENPLSIMEFIESRAGEQATQLYKRFIAENAAAHLESATAAKEEGGSVSFRKQTRWYEAWQELEHYPELAQRFVEKVENDREYQGNWERIITEKGALSKFCDESKITLLQGVIAMAGHILPPEDFSNFEKTILLTADELFDRLTHKPAGEGRPKKMTLLLRSLLEYIRGDKEAIQNPVPPVVYREPTPSPEASAQLARGEKTAQKLESKISPEKTAMPAKENIARLHPSELTESERADRDRLLDDERTERYERTRPLDSVTLEDLLEGL